MTLGRCIIRAARPTLVNSNHFFVHFLWYCDEREMDVWWWYLAKNHNKALSWHKLNFQRRCFLFVYLILFTSQFCLADFALNCHYGDARSFDHILHIYSIEMKYHSNQIIHQNYVNNLIRLRSLYSPKLFRVHNYRAKGV